MGRLDKLLFALTGKMKVNKTIQESQKWRKVGTRLDKKPNYEGSSSWGDGSFMIFHSDGTSEKINH